MGRGLSLRSEGRLYVFFVVIFGDVGIISSFTFFGGILNRPLNIYWMY